MSSYAIKSSNVAVGVSNVYCLREGADGFLRIGRDTANATIDHIIIPGNLEIAGNIILQNKLTKTDIGLANVSDVLQIAASDKGVANGVATLNSSGFIPYTQLPETLTSNVSIPLSDKGAVNGVATLDSSGTVPLTQLPATVAINATKASIGLGNVIDVLQLAASEKGVANGVATLNANGFVPTTQLPSNLATNITKTNLGLGNVIDVLQIAASEKAVANGVATLNSSGVIPLTQLPGSVTANVSIPLSDKGAVNGVATLDSSAKLTSSQLPDTLGNITGTTASRVLVTSGTNIITSSNVTTTQLDGFLTLEASKQAVITGAASTVTVSNLDTSKVVVTNVSGKLANGNVSITEIDTLRGITSNVQTQLDGKIGNGATIYAANGLVATPGITFSGAPTTGMYLPLANTIGLTCGTTERVRANASGITVTGNVTVTGLDGDSVVYVDANKKLMASIVTASELDFLSGVTSDIQTQLDGMIVEGGTVSAANGSASTPGITFSGAPTTGMYLPLANTIGLTCGTTERLRANASGITVTGNVSATGLTASAALVTNASKQLISSAVTSTELGYLSGVTSALQTQINGLSGGGGGVYTSATGTATSLLVNSKKAMMTPFYLATGTYTVSLTTFYSSLYNTSSLGAYTALVLISVAGGGGTATVSSVSTRGWVISQVGINASGNQVYTPLYMSQYTGGDMYSFQSTSITASAGYYRWLILTAEFTINVSVAGTWAPATCFSGGGFDAGGTADTSVVLSQYS